jgi:uncharacterized protein (TIGR02246 family)
VPAYHEGVSAASFADDLAIRRLLAEYCHLADDGDYAGLADQFTDDGVFVFGDRVTTGRAAIQTWLAALPAERRGKHLTTNSVVDIDGAVARVVSDFVFFVKSGEAVVPELVGRYHDDLRRDNDGGWRFHRREAIPL